MFATPATAEQLIVSKDCTSSGAVAETLSRYGVAALRYALDAGIRVVVLKAGQRYSERSAALCRLGVDVDGWPAPPAGLFVVEEKTVYLRSCSAMTVAHEFGHALDCALGGGIYRSGVDPRIQRMFRNALSFITPYASTAVDEYFAESLRAYVEANDSKSLWPRVSRVRLRSLDPVMFDFIHDLFTKELERSKVTRRELIAHTNATKRKFATSELPPYDIKGRVMPVSGKSPITPPTMINT